MTEKFDICIVSGKRKNQKGEEKDNWVVVGTLHKKQDEKMFITIDPFIDFSTMPKNERGGVSLNVLKKEKEYENLKPIENVKYLINDDVPF